MPIDISKITNENIYSNALITKKVTIDIKYIGDNIKEVLEKKLAKQLEGKCSVEGYIKPGTIKIITYSSGLIETSSILFEIVLECQICLPVENMLIKCKALNITKAGIRAQLNEEPSPLIIFIARDHHYKNPELFSSIKESDEIIVKIIGQRFELNDPAISVIAELIDFEKKIKKKKKQPKLIIEAK
jgi:DNA-directed RNA polymerase subunit E'/Rpb7|tara:strand:+ start:515 stop:1075 length:561 start_codon:yes stop_codon:yes gene_type:complete